jgi:replicative DNA helicase
MLSQRTPSAGTDEPLPPHATEAERALLGACILDAAATVPQASALLEPRDFYHPAHAEIFGALCAFGGRGVIPDLVLLADELARTGSLSRVGGFVYLSRLATIGQVTLRVDDYIALIYTCSFQRAMIAVSGRIALIAYESQSEVSSTIDRVLSEVEQVRARFAIERREEKRARPIPPPTWKRLDRSFA